MASVIDSIIGAIILVAVVIAVGLFVASAVTRNTTSDLQQERLGNDQSRTDTAINAILTSTDNETGRSISELIGQSMLTLRTTITLKGKTVDVVNATKERLDLVFGKDNYYITIKPIVKGVNLVFVLDSSPSVEQERDTIAKSLGTIQQRIKDTITTTGEEKVSIQIYLLPSDKSDCDRFTALRLPDLTCEQLTESTLYNKLENWKQPDFGVGGFANWQQQGHFAQMMSFAQSDWAAGTATAALRFESNAYLKNAVNINLIFPLSDELPTSSKNDVCFTKVKAEDWYMCQLCDGTCPLARSRNATIQAIAIVNTTSSVVFPIFSVNCDYSYDTGSNSLSMNPTNGAVTSNDYIKGFLDDKSRALQSYPAESWCQQNACTGCTNKSGGFCFHDACKQELYDQMFAMANATNGSIFNVNNAGEIPDNVIGAFNHVTASYDFQIGFPDLTRDRYVYEKVITLPNGKLGKIALWVYRGKEQACKTDADCVTNDECDGTRACVNGNLSDACVKKDPACLGKPCTGPELCATPDDCIGTRACVAGVLAQFCTKTDKNCGPECIDDCPYIGATSCGTLSSGATTNGTFVCAKGKDGCLKYHAGKTCQTACNAQNTTCVEDVCPISECGVVDGTCTPNERSCDYDSRCVHHPDCPPPCLMPCNSDGKCNVYCSAMPESCKPDPDCPSCMPSAGDRCPYDTPSCCAAGTTWIWGQHESSPYYQASCGYNEAPLPLHGACCADPNSCVVYQGTINCLNPGDTTKMFGTNYACEDKVLRPCVLVYDNPPNYPSPCKGATPPLWCHNTITIGAKTLTCDHDTGTWSG